MTSRQIRQASGAGAVNQILRFAGNALIRAGFTLVRARCQSALRCDTVGCECERCEVASQESGN